VAGRPRAAGVPARAATAKARLAALTAGGRNPSLAATRKAFPMFAAGATFPGFRYRPASIVWHTAAGFAGRPTTAGLPAPGIFIPNARGPPIGPAEARVSRAMLALGRWPPVSRKARRSGAAGRRAAESITDGASRNPRGASLAIPGAASAKSAFGFSLRLAKVETLLASVRQSMLRRRRY
jgi:hypothetical protein